MIEEWFPPQLAPIGQWGPLLPNDIIHHGDRFFTGPEDEGEFAVKSIGFYAIQFVRSEMERCCEVGYDPLVAYDVIIGWPYRWKYAPLLEREPSYFSEPLPLP